MNFKKLLLATSIAALSTTSFAMQAMDEEALSDTTGQDGLTITVANANLGAFNIILHDTDGFGGTVPRTFDGAIGITGIDVTSALNMTIDVDAGSDALAGTSNALQVKIYGAAVTVNLGSLTVANSARDSAAWGITGTATTVASLGSLTIGATTSAAPLLNIQMGAEPQGAWMALKPVFTGGLSITGFALYDSTGGGGVHGIGIGTLAMIDTAGGANLTANMTIDASATGLNIGITQLGTAAGMDVRMSAVRLGVAASSPSIGDVEIVGLNLAGTTLSVIGH